MKLKHPKRKQRFALRVIKGGYAPADASTAAVLRDKGHRVGDLVFAEFSKPRNPGFHRLVHQFGTLIATNIDAFTGKQAHDVLKRLQIEGDIGCDHIALVFPGVGPVEYRQARSLSFEAMDDGEFKEIYHQFADHVSKNYWRGLSPEEIQQIAAIMPEETA
jgi:hypothetical protein